MKLNRTLLLFVIISLSALIQANRPNNSDNPDITPIGKVDTKPTPPVVKDPPPPPEVPTTGVGYKNFTKTCKAGSYSFNTSNYNLTAQCLNARGSYVSTTIKLDNCFNADSNYNLEQRGTFGNYLYTDCKTCSLNLKTLFLTCNCEGRTTNPLNLNIWVLNSGGSLVC